MIVTRNLSQRYPATGGGAHSDLSVLEAIDLEVGRGGVVAVLGPSGSGKTTLLGLLAGLDRPSSGSIELDGVAIDGMDEDERAALRAERIGFVFQSFQLVPTLTALENVLVPLELLPPERRPDAAEGEARARRWLERVGLGARLTHHPAQLSGGEQQRVGIARAFASEPRILFADEPTGNLDVETGETIVRLLFDLNRSAGTTLVLVTHDQEMAKRAERRVHIDRGKIVREES